MGTQKKMIARESGCSIITAGPVAPNWPFKIQADAYDHAAREYR
jgi:hypothetical protein